MLRIGLTGGIASGKSTVAAQLREFGAPIVDADVVARQVVETGSEGLAEVVRAFGTGVLAPDGSLDRQALGSIVFSSEERRKRLNGILHPRIAQASWSEMERYRLAGEPVAIYEAALLVENQLHKTLDGLIVVAIPAELQLERLMLRDNLTETEARQRLSSQLPLSEKLAVADYVIDNSGSLDETRDQVVQLWRELVSQASAAGSN